MATIMYLSEIKKGKHVKFLEIPDENVRAQAIRFGIAKGEIANVGEVVPAGPVVLIKNNQEIAIGRSLAESITVELL